MADTRGARDANTDPSSRADSLFKVSMAVAALAGMDEETFGRIFDAMDRLPSEDGANTSLDAVVAGLRSTSPDFAKQWEAGRLPEALAGVEAGHQRLLGAGAGKVAP